MRTKRPPRLQSQLYMGLQRYFVTTCCAYRRSRFAEPNVVRFCCEQLLHGSQLFGMAVPAYCFMPDHVHLVLAAESEWADLRAFVKQFKQKTGFVHSQRYGAPLWQPGYYDRVLRDDEETETVVRYVLANPVRAGLCRTAEEYPYGGSFVYEIQELLSNWRT
jgi:putative transposase